MIEQIDELLGYFLNKLKGADLLDDIFEEEIDELEEFNDDDELNYSEIHSEALKQLGQL